MNNHVCLPIIWGHDEKPSRQHLENDEGAMLPPHDSVNGKSQGNKGQTLFHKDKERKSIGIMKEVKVRQTRVRERSRCIENMT
jgi:hypothetical protein